MLICSRVLQTFTPSSFLLNRFHKGYSYTNRMTYKTGKADVSAINDKSLAMTYLLSNIVDLLVAAVH